MSAEVERPSDARRAALSGAIDMGEKGVPVVSNMVPLDRYYSVAESVSACAVLGWEGPGCKDYVRWIWRFEDLSI